MLVVVLGAALEPLGEGRVELRSLGRRQGRVGDVTRERMLDRILAFAGYRRPDPAPDEIALLEQAEVGAAAVDQLVDRPGPEDAPDHRRRLQRRLLVGRQEVDASCEHCAHRVGHLEVRRQLADRPATVPALEHPQIDQRGQELFDEERVALGPLDDDAAQRVGKFDAEELVEQLPGVERRQCVELQS